MTTTRSNAGNSSAARGRGLDALFESAASPVAASSHVEADLAALLDDEVLAATVGAPDVSEPLVAAPAAAVASTRAATAAALPETIDVPPAASEARPVTPPQATAPPVSEPAMPAPAFETPPQLPTTKRFGAIIMESAPQETPPDVQATPSASASDALVPTMPGTRSVMPPTSGVEEEVTPLPAAVDRTEDQKAIVISRLDKVLDKGWQRALHQEIDGLYKQVATEFASPPEKAERALSMLREARQVLLNTPEEYVAAEYRTMQVRALLDRMQVSRKKAVVFGPRILLYQAAWLVVLLALLIFAAPLTQWITRVGNVTGAALLNLYPIVNTMIWGGIGGIVGALYALWWHISEQQDFDPNYLTWYLVQPLMGVVLGGIIFLILAGGFLILQVDLTDEKATQGARLLPYLTAVLAGFRQNFVYQQFDRLIALFTPSQRSGNGNGTPGEGPAA